MIPTYERCFEAWNRHSMLENIRAHSLLVARIAHYLAQALNARGVRVSVRMATAGALMHDIGKTRSIASGEDHSDLGKRICISDGFVEIADIVAEHVRLRHFELNGVYSEKEIVYYADKRVNHDRIVSLEERLHYIIERYGGNDPARCSAIRTNFERCRLIEMKIFTKLDLKPETLGLRLREDAGEPKLMRS